MVGVSDQSIIDREGILMQILLVAALKIVLFASKHAVANLMSVRGALYKTTVTIPVHRLSVYERLLLPTLVPRIDLCVFALSFSARPSTCEKLVKTIVSPYRNSQQTIHGTVVRRNRRRHGTQF